MGAQAWYNEWDPEIAAWLRQLIADGRVPAGDVDESDVTKLEGVPDAQHHHFFAGIGGWALALELAGWPAEREVWTGSCPCQPFSRLGKRSAHFDDDRHVWPSWFRLIRQHRPVDLFGEQVASGPARAWVAGVQADMEYAGYGFAYAVLPACGVGAPHERTRLWWHARLLADADCVGTYTAAPQERSGAGEVDLHFPWRGWRTRAFRDRKRRRLASPTELPVGVDGISARLGRIANRGAGNAIVPQVAAAFVRACMDAPTPAR